MKCLTVRQPWAWLIIHGGKDIENRTWRTHYTGPLLIHAAATRPTFQEYKDACELQGAATRCITAQCGAKPPLYFPSSDELVYGAIIGRVCMTGCVNDSPSPWAMRGEWHWLLANPEPLDPIPYIGRQGLFEVEISPTSRKSRLAT